MSDDDKLMHHEYDGIREYDNPLPSWWSWIFIACIVHSAVYLYWFHGGGPGKSAHESYRAELGEWEKKRAAAPPEEIALSEDDLAGLSHDPDQLGRGRAVFVKNCVSCHLDDGRGQIGPNLTDLYQIHGSSRVDVYHTILDGVPDKGMLTWRGVLSPDEAVAVAAYVVSLRGKEIAGRPPDGHPVPRFAPSGP